MAYIGNTPQDVEAMLATIGVESIDELFADVPESVRLKAPVGPERALSEYEALRLMGERAAMNRPAATAYRNFIGAGAYEHTIPAAVGAIAQRGELLTAYTPYQPEVSQGTLQIVYEFQTMICRLTGMDVANASMYDGASALAEAVLMAVRISRRNQVLLPATLNPAWREVIRSYTHHLEIELIELPSDESGALIRRDGWPEGADDVAAVVIAQPNIFGFLEAAPELAAAARGRGALTIAAVNPMSLSVLEPPGSWGADIVVGECQPIGLPLNFGGPYAGFMATHQDHIRQMPGRIVGRTTDTEGRDGFVLTLQTREQHIRRERATSNICTNQGLCAAMVTVWLALVGKTGLEQLGEVNLDRAGRLAEGLTALPGVEMLSDAPFFNEFTVRLPMSAQEFHDLMREQDGILPGLPASRLGFDDQRALIVCATETKLDEDLEAYLDSAERILEQYT